MSKKLGTGLSALAGLPITASLLEASPETTLVCMAAVAGVYLVCEAAVDIVRALKS